MDARLRALIDQILSSEAVVTSSIGLVGQRGSVAVADVDDDRLARVVFDLAVTTREGRRRNGKLRREAECAAHATPHYGLLVSLAEKILPHAVDRRQLVVHAGRFVAGMETANPLGRSGAIVGAVPLTRCLDALRAAREAVDEMAALGQLKSRKRDLDRLKKEFATMAERICAAATGEPSTEDAHVTMDKLEKVFREFGFTQKSDLDRLVVGVATRAGIAGALTAEARRIRRRRRNLPETYPKKRSNVDGIVGFLSFFGFWA